MATVVEDVIGGRGFGGYGDGFGGGGLGLIALLALLGANRGGCGGGLLGGGSCGGSGVDALNNINGTIDTAAILGKLASIEGAIPLSEAQVQLALAGVQSSLSGQANTNTQFLGNQLQNLALNQLIQSNTIQTAVAAVDTNVDRQACATREAIHADGEATRALITSNRIADLEQQLTVSQLREAEGRQIIREQENSHNVTVQVNQQQAQSQLQFQRIDNMFSHLLNGFNQVARATNSQVVVGSTGVAGTQTANPTNVAA